MIDLLSCLIENNKNKVQTTFKQQNDKLLQILTLFHNS